MSNIKNLLCLWGIREDIIKTFIENEITEEILFKMSPEDIKELVPSVGVRIKITDEIKKIKDSRSETEAQSELQPVQCFNENVGSSQSNTHHYIATSKLPNFDLLSLLRANPWGQNLLSHYEANDSLDNSKRARLVDIIMLHIFEQVQNARLDDFEYRLLTSKVLKLFPTESPSTYYVPSVKKDQSPTGKTIRARGRFVDKLRNLKAIKRDANENSHNIRAKRRPNYDEESCNSSEVDTTADVEYLQENAAKKAKSYEPTNINYGESCNTSINTPSNSFTMINEDKIQPDMVCPEENLPQQIKNELMYENPYNNECTWPTQDEENQNNSKKILDQLCHITSSVEKISSSMETISSSMAIMQTAILKQNEILTKLLANFQK